jgi:hypothetical protein
MHPCKPFQDQDDVGAPPNDRATAECSGSESQWRGFYVWAHYQALHLWHRWAEGFLPFTGMPGASWFGQEYFDYVGAHTSGTGAAYPDTPPAVSLQRCCTIVGRQHARDVREPLAKGLCIRPPREVVETHAVAPWERRAEDVADAHDVLGCVDGISRDYLGEVEEEEEDNVDALLACVVASFCDPHVRGVGLGEALDEPADARVPVRHTGTNPPRVLCPLCDHLVCI